jgi:glycosyltransferase involved in cell wall biosynthesis
MDGWRQQLTWELQMPTISVVIPAFNAGPTLKRAIDSVLGQSFADFEVIVCNDGSVDETAGILEGYGSKITAIHQENRGRGAARNRCLERATGEFIALLDADDWWMPHKLEVQIDAARRFPDFGVYYANSYIVNGNGMIYRTMNGRWHVGHSGWIFPYLVRNNFVPTSTVLARTAAVRAAGFFDDTLPRCQDLEWFLRLAALVPFHYTNELLAFYDDRTWSTPDKHIDTYAMFLRVLDKARALHPAEAKRCAHNFSKSYSDCHSELARQSEKLADHARAAEHYQNALECTPNSRVLKWKLGLALYTAGHFDSCEATLANILDDDPYHVEAHFYLGNIHLARGNASEARKEYELSLYDGYLYQQFPECVNNLGVVCAMLGEPNRALELCEQASAQQDFYSDALWNIENLRQGRPLDTLKWTKRKVF